MASQKKLDKGEVIGQEETRWRRVW